MKWRRISEDEVKEVLERPDSIEKSIRGRINAFRKTGGRFLKVTFKESPDEILIISAVDKGK